MGKRRIDNDDEDGLNLLLDTVCNMFGIFVFSALVVAILALARSSHMQAQGNPRPVSLDEGVAASRLQDSIDSLTTQIAMLRNSRALTLAEKAEEARKTRNAADRELAARREILEDYLARLEKSDNIADELRSQVPELRRQIAEYEAALQRARDVKEIETRTPLRRSLEGRIPVQIVLHDNRAFILNSWWEHVGTDSHPCDIWCDWNDRDVNAAASECRVVRCIRGGEIEIHRSALLRDGKGLPADDAQRLAGDAAWRSFTASLDPQKHVVSIRCSPTGFGAFGPVRGEVVRLGLPYNVEPTHLDPYYRDSIIQGTPVGQ